MLPPCFVRASRLGPLRVRRTASCRCNGRTRRAWTPKGAFHAAPGPCSASRSASLFSFQDSLLRAGETYSPHHCLLLCNLLQDTESIQRTPIFVKKNRFYSTISSVPAAIRAQPTMDLGVNCSFRMTAASTMVMTILSLSIGMTLDASPNCSAL